jgi:hypothetical protein
MVFENSAILQYLRQHYQTIKTKDTNRKSQTVNGWNAPNTSDQIIVQWIEWMEKTIRATLSHGNQTRQQETTTTDTIISTTQALAKIWSWSTNIAGTSPK